MILYHVSTVYQLLACIVHKLAYYEDEDCDILIMEYIVAENEREQLQSRLEETGWFRSVWLLPEQKLTFQRGGTLDERSTPKQIKKIAEKIADSFAAWWQEDPHKYRKIYVGSDHWSFGTYLLVREIPYYYLEDASGMLSQEERYLSIIKRINMTCYIIVMHYNGIGRSDLVIEKLCDLRNQMPGFEDPKAVDFSIYHTLKYEIPQRIEAVLKFYQVTPVRVGAGERCSIFLTQHLKTLSIRILDMQELLSTLLIDYFCTGHQLIVKPHPKDCWLNYNRIFPDAMVLPNDFPAELLPFIMEGQQPDTAITASSTSIGGMQEYALNSYSFGEGVENRIDQLHVMYMAATILSHIGISEVSLRNIHEIQMESFLRFRQISTTAAAKYWIDGGIGQESMILPQEEEVIVYLSLDQALYWNPLLDASKLIYVRGGIKKQKNSLLHNNHFHVFVFCRDDQLREKLLQLEEEKDLGYTRGRLYIQAEVVTKELFQRFTKEWFISTNTNRQ